RAVSGLVVHRLPHRLRARDRDRERVDDDAAAGGAVKPAPAYVDFEALKSPLHPALIGILVDRGKTESFEQVVVDELLRPAVVARKHVRYATLEAVVARIVDLDLPIVGWSLFDRDLV